MTEKSGGRRAHRTTEQGRRVGLRARRVDILVVLGLILPTVATVALAILGDEPTRPQAPFPPAQSDLSAATVVCAQAVPSERTGGDLVTLRSPGVRGGPVAVRTIGSDGRLGDPTDIDVSSDRPVLLPRTSAGVVLDAEGSAAPGLVAGRRAAAATQGCREPGYDEWFLGGGASARNASLLEFVNPDPGQAVVDVTLLGKHGQLDEPGLRDIPIPGNSAVTIDLAKEAPRRLALAIRVSVTRGRVATAVRQTSDPLGRGTATTDFLPAQSSPATDQLLLGAERFGPSDTVFLANPGDDEARAAFRVLTEEAAFMPEGIEDVVVPPHSLTRVRLGSIVDKRSAKGMVGLEISASGPIVATLRGLAGSDLVAVGAAPGLPDPTAVVVPVGRARLLISGAQRSGTVHITGYTEDGTVVLDDKTVRVSPDRTSVVSLAPQVVALTVEARNATVSAAISSRDRRSGVSVVPVVPSDLRAEIPTLTPR